MTRWQAALAVTLVMMTVAISGCSGSSDPSCDELRAELAAIDLTPAAAWDDIIALQNDVERGLRLQQTIEQRC